MTLSKKYNEIMDKVVVTDEMRQAEKDIRRQKSSPVWLWPARLF